MFASGRPTYKGSDHFSIACVDFTNTDLDMWCNLPIRLYTASQLTAYNISDTTINRILQTMKGSVTNFKVTVNSAG